MAQTEQILRYMKRRGSITPLQALHYYNCMRLSARIHDLRTSGHTILTEIIERGGKRFARYRLVA